MTVIEFRMFFDALPEEEGLNKPSKRKFAQECGISVTVLKQMAGGKAPFSGPKVARLLPVMQKYGFEG